MLQNARTTRRRMALGQDETVVMPHRFMMNEHHRVDTGQVAPEVPDAGLEMHLDEAPASLL